MNLQSCDPFYQMQGLNNLMLLNKNWQLTIIQMFISLLINSCAVDNAEDSVNCLFICSAPKAIEFYSIELYIYRQIYKSAATLILKCR